MITHAILIAFLLAAIGVTYWGNYMQKDSEFPELPAPTLFWTSAASFFCGVVGAIICFMTLKEVPNEPAYMGFIHLLEVGLIFALVAPLPDTHKLDEKRKSDIQTEKDRKARELAKGTGGKTVAAE